MLYGRKQFKFVFIGAGSSSFTLRLVGDILGEDFIENAEIALVDINKVLLGEVKSAVSNLVSYAGKHFSVKSHADFHDALPGADFVFFIYATGGYAAWKKDIEICTRHGVYQSVGDTIGPGGIIRTLRTIPVALEIAHEMEKVCPDAWVINYTNPEGALCLALQTHTKIRSFGLCHGTPDTARDLAAHVFHVDPARLSYRAGGVNHLTWFTDLTIDGEDVYPRLFQMLSESGYASKEPVSFDLFRIFGLYPAPGDRHVEEFFPNYLKKRVMDERNLAWKNNDFVVIDGWREKSRAHLEDVMKNNKGYEDFLKGSGETSSHFMRSLATGKTTTEMVNVVNRGYIENISDGIIVEVPTFVDNFGLHPQKIGRLPEGIAAKCDALGREYLLAVEAARTGDPKLALQAFMLDPLSANCEYPERLFEELLVENVSLLPSCWNL